MNGTIYSIKCKTTGEQYIGSTCKHVEYRLEQHRCKTNKTSSRAIIDRKNFECIILESVICDSKKELLYRERFFIETEQNVINKSRPIITEIERKASILAYERAHPEYYKAYRDSHRDKYQGDWICECGMKCRFINKYRHHRSEQHKKWVEKQTNEPDIRGQCPL
jgi:hypothetical protein